MKERVRPFRRGPPGARLARRARGVEERLPDFEVVARPDGLRWYQHPPGRILQTCVGAVAVWLLVACSGPALTFTVFTAGFVLFVVGVTWAIRTLVFLHARPGGSPRGRRTWLVPAVVAGCLLLSVTGAGFQVRWALSRPSFDAAVRAHRAGDPVEGHVGLFMIVMTEDKPGGTVLWDSGGNGFDDAGFAYFPDGPGAGLGDGSWESPQFTPIGGGWYTWTASW